MIEDFSKLPPAISGTKAAPKPEGWWSLPGDEFHGSREGVIEAIKQAKAIPAGDRDYILYRIGKVPEKFNYITVHAHVCVNQTDKKFDEMCDLDVKGKITL